MAKVLIEMEIEKIKELVSQLSPAQIMELLEELRKRLETEEMMKIAESAFSEWDRPEENIYNE